MKRDVGIWSLSRKQMYLLMLGTQIIFATWDHWSISWGSRSCSGRVIHYAHSPRTAKNRRRQSYWTLRCGIYMNFEKFGEGTRSSNRNFVPKNCERSSLAWQMETIAFVRFINVAQLIKQRIIEEFVVLVTLAKLRRVIGNPLGLFCNNLVLVMHNKLLGNIRVQETYLQYWWAHGSKQCVLDLSLELT